MPSTTSRWCALFTVLLACSIAESVPIAAQEHSEVVPQAAARVADDLAGRPTAGAFQEALAWSPFEEVAPTPAVGVVAVQDRARGNTHVAMMGVGAAAVVVGLIIGGDNGTIIATVGGVIGLVGLYRYLR
jgi:hypothetical protein